jgi:hypothetical protein
MVAYNLEGVRNAFSDKELAAEFGQKFIKAYAATPFGSLPKTEIDLQVFSILVDLKVIEINRAAYRMARALNITPTKAQALLFQYQLRNISGIMAQTPQAFRQGAPNSGVHGERHKAS